jgi:ubiquitin C
MPAATSSETSIQPVVASPKTPVTPQRTHKFAPNMKIFVNTPTGTTITLAIRGDDPIQYIKAKILHMERYPIVDQRLVFEGQELMEGKTLAMYGVQNGAVLRLLSGMQIFVKTLQGKTWCINVEESDRIEDVKHGIKRQVPTSEHDDKDNIVQQRIVFNGNFVRQGSTLTENGIRSMMTVSMAKAHHNSW